MTGGLGDSRAGRQADKPVADEEAEPCPYPGPLQQAVWQKEALLCLKSGSFCSTYNLCFKQEQLKVSLNTNTRTHLLLQGKAPFHPPTNDGGPLLLLQI